MTRIIAGAAGSLPLRTPPSNATRPTSDRVREAIFSALEAADAIAGASVIDLYAGSGALGLEALSRGAERVVLVDRDAKAARACRANAEQVSAAAQAPAPSVRTEQASAAAYLARQAGTGAAFDLAFIDPPYDMGEDELGACLTDLAPLLTPDAILVVERSSRSPEPAWPGRITPYRRKAYGETVVWYAQPSA